MRANEIWEIDDNVAAEEYRNRFDPSRNAPDPEGDRLRDELLSGGGFVDENLIPASPSDGFADPGLIPESSFAGPAPEPAQGLPALNPDFVADDDFVLPTLAEVREEYRATQESDIFEDNFFESRGNGDRLPFIDEGEEFESDNAFEGGVRDFVTGIRDGGARAENRQIREEGGFFDTSDFGGERDIGKAYIEGANDAAARFDNPLIQFGAMAVGGASSAVGEAFSTGLMGDVASVPIEVLDEISMASELASSVLREISVPGDNQTIGSRLWTSIAALSDLSSGNVDLGDVMRVAGQGFALNQLMTNLQNGEEVDFRDIANVVSLDPGLAERYSDIQVPSGHAAWQAVTGGPEAVQNAYERIENKQALLEEKEKRANVLAIIAEDPTADDSARDAAALARAQIGVEIEEERNKSASDIANEHTSFAGDLLFDLMLDPGIILDKVTDVIVGSTRATSALRAERKAIEVSSVDKVVSAIDDVASPGITVDTPTAGFTSTIDRLNAMSQRVRASADADALKGTQARQSSGWSLERLKDELNPATRLASGLADEAVDGLAFTMSAILNGVESKDEARSLLRLLADAPTRFIDEGLTLADLPSRQGLFDSENVFLFAESTIANTGFVNNFDVLSEAAARQFPIGDWVDNMPSLRGGEPLSMRELQSDLFESLRYAANDIYGVAQAGGAFEHGKAGTVALKAIAGAKKLISELNLFSRPAYTVNNAISGNVFLADDGLLTWSSFDDLTSQMTGWFGQDSAITGRLAEAIGTISDDVIRTATGELAGPSGESIFRKFTMGKQNPISWWVEQGISISQGTGGIGNLPVGEQRMYLTAFASGMQQALHRQVATTGDNILASLAELDVPAELSAMIRNELTALETGAENINDVRRRINQVLSGAPGSFPWAASGVSLDNIPLAITNELNDLVRSGTSTADELIESVTSMVQDRINGLGEQFLANPPSFTESNLFDVNMLQDASSTLDELKYAAEKSGIPPLPPEEVNRINDLFEGIETGMTDLIGLANVDVVFDAYQDILARMDEVRRLTDVSSEQAQRGERAWDTHYSEVQSAWDSASASITDIYAQAADAANAPGDYQRRYTSTQDDRIAQLLNADERTLRENVEAGILGSDEQFKAALESQRLIVDRARFTAFQAVRESGDIASFNIVTSANRMVENLNAQAVAWRNHMYQEWQSGATTFQEFRTNISELWRERADLAEWMWANSAREVLVRHGEDALRTDVLFQLGGDELELLRPLSSEVDGWVVRNPDGGKGIVGTRDIPDEAIASWRELTVDWSDEGERLTGYADSYDPSSNGYQPLVFDEPQDIIFPDELDDDARRLAGLIADDDGSVFNRGLEVLEADEIAERRTLSQDELLRAIEGPLPIEFGVEPPSWLDIDEYLGDTPINPPDNNTLRMADHDPANSLFDRERLNNQRFQGVNGPDVGDMNEHIRRDLDRLVEYVRNNSEDILKPFDTGFGALDGRQRLDVRTRIRDGLANWEQSLLTASQEAVNRADFNMVNYAKTRNIDAVLSVISPWSYWSTRTMTSYAERMLNHPRLLTMNQSVDRNIARENENNDVNRWHEGTLPNPFPFGPERLRDPRFSAFPTGGLYHKEARDLEQLPGGDRRYGGVTPVMNEINRWFGTSPYIEYSADVAAGINTDGFDPSDLSPYNYIWPMKTGGLILSAAGVTHAGGSDNLASNIIEEAVASGEIDLDTAQFIQHYMLTGETPPEAAALGLDLAALSEQARRTASRRKLGGASGIGTLLPVGGYFDTQASQDLRAANTSFRALAFDEENNPNGSDRARDVFLEDNPAIRSVFTGSQLSPTFQREEGDRFPAAISADRNTFDLRDSVTGDMFSLQGDAKDAAIRQNPDISRAAINKAGTDALLADAKSRLGADVVAEWERSHKGYSSLELVNFVWNTLADQAFPSRTPELTPPEFTGSGYAPYELDERDFGELLRDFTQFRRPPFPTGENPTSEQWDVYRSGMEERYAAQLAVAQRYIDGAAGHELRIINGRTAAELVEAGDNRYKTDLEVERLLEIQAQGEATHAHWEKFLGIAEDDWDARRKYVADNPDFESLLEAKAIAEKSDFWWREGDARRNPEATRSNLQVLWDDFRAIGEDDWDGRRIYIAQHPEFEAILKAKADAAGKEYWWKSTGGKPGSKRQLWQSYLAIDGDDFEAKRQYIEDNPSFEAILKARADADGKEYWWTDDAHIAGSNKSLWGGYLAIAGDDFDSKKRYIADNPDFAALLKAKADADGKDYWWEKERGSNVRDFPGRRSSGRSFGSGRNGSSSGLNPGQRRLSLVNGRGEEVSIVTDSRRDSNLIIRMNSLTSPDEKCALIASTPRLLEILTAASGGDLWWQRSVAEGGFGCLAENVSRL